MFLSDRLLRPVFDNVLRNQSPFVCSTNDHRLADAATNSSGSVPLTSSTNTA